MKTVTQPVILSGYGGGGGDTVAPTMPGKAPYYCKYLGGSGGTWDLHFPGAKRAIVTAINFGGVAAVDSVNSGIGNLPIRIECRSTAGSLVNGGWFFVAQVWY
ncbi:MAG: hypothetical protein ABWY25_01270 [Paenisporosarcina sp.]